MLKLGDYNTLRIVKRVDFGLYLDGGDEGEILMPKRYCTPQMQIGDEVEVFIYLDQDERVVGTTEKPFAKVGEFACLEVAWTNQYGAFLKWGLMKDLFCPFREQKQRMVQGHRYIVYVKEDEESHRLMATAKVEKYLSPLMLSKDEADNESPEQQKPAQERLVHGDAVDCLIWQKTDLGFKAIINNKYQGQLYDNQIFRQLFTGDRLTAYVDHIRQDGKIDLMLQPTGRKHTLDFAEVLLRYLHENDGFCDLGDKSPAELIADRFKVSKKAYKKAIGDLYRRRLITISDEGIRLT
ncbi:MAG: GntR family transcriptional regulator [Prevotella sp.]|nr:GntR family transcriptional regulator [Prevotella sp.]